MGEIALIHNFAAFTSGFRTNVDEIVGRADNILVVLHHNHRVADFLKHLQHPDEAFSVARMQPDAWFVENV